MSFYTILIELKKLISKKIFEVLIYRVKLDKLL